jgi:hypothetical protein
MMMSAARSPATTGFRRVIGEPSAVVASPRSRSGVVNVQVT